MKILFSLFVIAITPMISMAETSENGPWEICASSCHDAQTGAEGAAILWVQKNCAGKSGHFKRKECDPSSANKCFKIEASCAE